MAILTAVDKKSVLLFCSSWSSARSSSPTRPPPPSAAGGRRQELGVLACLGWTRPRLFATVLGELAVIGLTAGLLGGLLSLPLPQHRICMPRPAALPWRCRRPWHSR